MWVGVRCGTTRSCSRIRTNAPKPYSWRPDGCRVRGPAPDGCSACDVGATLGGMVFALAILALLAGGPGAHYRVYVFAAAAAGQPSDEVKARREGGREILEARAKAK